MFATAAAAAAFAKGTDTLIHAHTQIESFDQAVLQLFFRHYQRGDALEWSRVNAKTLRNMLLPGVAVPVA